MNRRPVDAYEKLLKSQGNRIYSLNVDNTGLYVQLGGTSSGNYTIVEYNEFLDRVNSVSINMQSIDECSATTFSGTCDIKDFDVDLDGNIWISIKIKLQSTSKFHTNLYKLDNGGNLSMNLNCENNFMIF